MTDTDIVAIAKEAYVLSEQLHAMRESMEREGKDATAYHAHARTYRRLLERAKHLLKADPTLAQTVEHLAPYDEKIESGYYEDFTRLRADLPVLAATLRAFFQFHFPAKEKARVGFTTD